MEDMDWEDKRERDDRWMDEEEEEEEWPQN